MVTGCHRADNLSSKVIVMPSHYLVSLFILLLLHVFELTVIDDPLIDDALFDVYNGVLIMFYDSRRNVLLDVFQTFVDI